MKGLEIKEFRESILESTQENFAQIIGVSTRTLQVWEASEKLNENAVKKLKNRFIEIVGEGQNIGDIGNDKISYYKAITTYKLEVDEDSNKKTHLFKESINKQNLKDLGYVNVGEAFKNQEKEIKNTIPLLPYEAIGGLSGGETIGIRKHDIKEQYNVPDFVSADFMIRVKGSSMYPKYNSGDVVACKLINESNFIQWNKVHVIATKEQGTLIKRLKKGSSETSLLAISDNNNYDPFEIPKKEILNIAIVIGVIRLE